MPRFRSFHFVIVLAMFLISATLAPLNTKLLASHGSSHHEKMSEVVPRVSMTSKGSVAGEIEVILTSATVRISVSSDGIPGNAQSINPSVSADGRYVAFVSNADNLFDSDTNGVSDIFIHDNQTNQTTCVSVASDGALANSESYAPSISADGRYVAFTSSADNLVSGDTNETSDVFIHDTQPAQTVRVSVASDGTQGNGYSFLPSISADGRYVAFVSRASNLASGDTNDLADIFLHDTQTNQITRISIASDGTQGNGESWAPAVSADGRYVAFQTDANNLVDGDTNAATDIFVRDTQANQITRVSVASDGTQGDRASYGADISADGQFVAFVSDADNLVGGDTNGGRDTFRHDTQTNETIRVSVAPDGTQANSESFDQPSISADGRYVAFTSIADNLVSGDTNGQWDLFVHDAQTSQNTRASVASNGTQVTIFTVYNPSISADGRYVAFQSDDANLVASDTNGAYDIFIHDRGPSLDLPFWYSNFAQSALGNYGNNPGRVNSWLDHTSPDYSENMTVTVWSGKVYTDTIIANLNSMNCNTGRNCYNGHNGIDFQHNINVPKETIYAAAPGIVTGTVTTCAEGNKSCGNYYGNQVWVDHGGGYATLYGHLQAVSVTVGTQITNIISRPLGIMGNTGNSTGIHLHFGFYSNRNSDGHWTQDEVVDPYGWNILQLAGSAPDPWKVPSEYSWIHPLNRQMPISSTGASISSVSGNIVVIVPAGALSTTVAFDLWDTPPIAEPSAQLRTIGHSFWLDMLQPLAGSNARSNQDVQSAAAIFAQPVTVSVTYATLDVMHLDPNQLTLFRWDASTNMWTPLSTTVDITQNQAVAQTTEIGNFDLQAPLLCPSNDQEPDDSYYTAKAVTTDGVPASRLFDNAQDEDWFQLPTIAGGKYTLQTSNLAPGAYVILQLYAQDGVTQLVSVDNGIGQASQLTWQASSSGIYFIRAVNGPSGAFGCNANYQLSVSQQLFVYLPFVLRNY